ncbi:MAG: hypothetical protein IKC03_04790, partial [Oscillospiraceae bacterium]|nr:hypothetical protein [Oscillospiraceae bacterium]
DILTDEKIRSLYPKMLFLCKSETELVSKLVSKKRGNHMENIKKKQWRGINFSNVRKQMGGKNLYWNRDGWETNNQTIFCQNRSRG